MSSPIETSENDRKQIRAVFNIHDPFEIAQKIQTLKQFAKKQNFDCDISEDEWFLEIMLLHAKFKTEIAENRIRTYFNQIGNYANLFSNLGNFTFTQEQGVILSSLTLTRQFERVIVVRMQTANVVSKHLDWNRIMQVVLTSAIINFHNDYSTGTRFVLDFDGVTLTHFKKLQPTLVFKLVRITQDIIKTRISGIELLNAPNLLNLVLPLAKMALTSKLFSRVTVHRNLESLHKNVSPDYLPIEYGGRFWTSDTLIQKWDELVAGQRPLLDKIAELANKRSKNNQQQKINIEPTFRLLDID